MLIEIRYDADGRVLCNVVDGCDELAELQATVDCKGCEETTAALEAGIERKNAERQQYLDDLDGIRQAFEAENRDPTDAERLAGRAFFNAQQDAAAAVEVLEAQAETIAVAHTHTVFACKAHMASLPG